MQVIPAIDLRDGACVQLVGGSYTDERVRIANPLAVAENWARLGFGRIHLVDLDAATGRGSNREIVRTILDARVTKQVQCGGGVRDLAMIDELLAMGTSEVVLGTRAIEDRTWLEDVVARYPEQNHRRRGHQRAPARDAWLVGNRSAERDRLRRRSELAPACRDSCHSG